MISVDAAGLRSRRFGSMGDQVEQLRVVFAQGEIADLGFVPWPAYDEEPATFTDLIVRKLQNLHRQSQKRLAQLMPAGLLQPRGLWALAVRQRDGDQPRPAGQRVGGDAGAGPPGGSEDRAPARRARRSRCCRSGGWPMRPASAAGMPGSGARPDGLRSLRLAVAQPGARRRPEVPRLDRRGGRVGPDRRVRGRPGRGGRRARPGC